MDFRGRFGLRVSGFALPAFAFIAIKVRTEVFRAVVKRPNFGPAPRIDKRLVLVCYCFDSLPTCIMAEH